MDLLGRDLTNVHGARGIGELVADPARFLEQLGLHRGEFRQRVVAAFARHARGHRRLADIGGLAYRALHKTARALLLIVGVRAEPGLERLAALAALEVED